MTNPTRPARLKMPDGLTVVMGISWFMTGFSILFYPFFWFVAHDASGTFTINNAPVDQQTFLAATTPFFHWSPIVPLLTGIVAYALWRERPWSREAAVIVLGFLALGETAFYARIATADDNMVVTAALHLLVVAGVAAYLFGAGSIRTYYRTLREREHAWADEQGPPQP